jgi:hypothetical protein
MDLCETEKEIDERIFTERGLEIALMEAKAGCLPHAGVLSVFLNTRIVVPSAAKVAGDSTGFQPLQFTKKQYKCLVASPPLNVSLIFRASLHFILK